MISTNVKYFNGNCSYEIYDDEKVIVYGELSYTADDVLYADTVEEVYNDFMDEIKNKIDFKKLSDDKISDVNEAIDMIVTGTKCHWDIYLG